MRRAFAVLAVLGLVLSLAAPVAAKGRPEIIRLEPTVLDEAFLAGTCDFPVELVDQSTNAKAMIFPPEDDGSQLTRATGGYVSTLTNLDTGESTTFHYYGKVDLDLQPDGSQRVTASGTVFMYVFEGDELSAFEPGLYLVTGSVRSHVGPDGFALSPERVKGRVVDLCAAVS